MSVSDAQCSMLGCLLGVLSFLVDGDAVAVAVHMCLTWYAPRDGAWFGACI